MTDHWGWVATLAVGLLFVGVTVAVLAALDGHVKAVFVSIGCLLALLLFGVLLLVAYGVIVIVLRNAFGIELPNPLNWLPLGWHKVPSAYAATFAPRVYR